MADELNRAEEIISEDPILDEESEEDVLQEIDNPYHFINKDGRVDYNKMQNIPEPVAQLSEIPTYKTEPVKDGNLFLTKIKRGTTLGSVATALSRSHWDSASDDEDIDRSDPYKGLSFVPDRHRDKAGEYVTAFTQERANQITAQLDKEGHDKLLEANAGAVKNFFYDLGAQALDPVNWPVFGVGLAARATGKLTKSAIVGTTTGLVSATAQEAALQATQRSRTFEESQANIIGSSIISGLLVTGGTALKPAVNKFTAAQRERWNKETGDVFLDKEPKLDKDGLLEKNDPAYLGISKLGLFTTEANRMIRSTSGTLKKAADRLISSSIIKEKHAQGESSLSVEQLVSLDTAELFNFETQANDIFYRQTGIDKGFFSLSRAEKIAADPTNNVLTRDQLNNQAVDAYLTEKKSTNPYVNELAQLMEKYQEKFTKLGVELNIFEEGISPRNAVNYLVQLHDKEKINSDVDGFKEDLEIGYTQVNEVLKDIYKNPEIIVKRLEIESISKQIAETKKGRSLTKKSVNEQVAKLKEQKDILGKEIATLKKENSKFISSEKERLSNPIKETTSKIKLIKKHVSDLRSKRKELEKEGKQTKPDSQTQDDIDSSKKREASFKAEISKLQTKRRNIRERQAVLKERLRAKKEGTKTYEKIKQDIENLPSAIVEIDKNISSLKEDLSKAQSITKSLRLKPSRDKKGAASNITSAIDAIDKNIADQLKDLERFNGELSKLNKELSEINALKKQSDPVTEKKIKEISSIENKIKRIKNQNTISKDARDELKILEDDLEAATKELEKKSSDIAGKDNRIYPEERNAIFHFIDGKRVLRNVLSKDDIKHNAEMTLDHINGIGNSDLNKQVIRALDAGKPSQFKERRLLLSQRRLRKWQISDPVHANKVMTRSLSPYLRLTELAKREGTERGLDLKDPYDLYDQWTKDLEAEFKENTSGPNKGNYDKELKKLNKNKKSLKNSFELVLGIYGDGPNVQDGTAGKVVRSLNMWNYIRLLGGMTLTAFADIGIPIITHGLYNYVWHGIRPAIKQSLGLMKNMSRDEINAINIAMNVENGSRARVLMGQDTMSESSTYFGKTGDRLSQGFGNVTFMNHWNDFFQRASAIVSINRTLKAAQTIARKRNGEDARLSKKDAERLAGSGLTQDQAVLLHEMWSESGSPQQDGTYFADWTEWKANTKEKQRAIEVFKSSIIKEVDQVVIKPGLGDKPNIAHTNIGKLLLQFKSFAFASTNHIFYAALQRKKDINTYTGLTVMMTAGTIGYLAAQASRGNFDIDLSMEQLATEAIDRSGVLGIFMEGYNLFSKFGLGFTTASRWESRGKWSAILGPSAGLIDTLEDSINFIRSSNGEKPLTSKQINRMFQLFPYQNLFYTQYISRRLLGITGTKSEAARIRDQYKDLVQ